MKLLLVNKNPIVRKLFKLSSEKAGIELSEIESLEALERAPFNLVFVDDENLEEGDVLARLKEELPQAKYGLLHAKNRERDAGFALFVQKPFLPTDLVDLFKSEIEASAQEFFQPDSPKSDESGNMSEPSEPAEEAVQEEHTLIREEESFGEEKLNLAEDMLPQESAHPKEEFNLEIANTPDISDDWALTLEENATPLSDVLTQSQEESSSATLNPEPFEPDFSTQEEASPLQPQQEIFEAPEESPLQEPQEQELQGQESQRMEEMQETQEAQEPMQEDVEAMSTLSAPEESVPSDLADDMVQNAQSEGDETAALMAEEAQESFELGDLQMQSEADFSLEDPLGALSETEETKEPTLMESPALEAQDDLVGALDIAEDSQDDLMSGADLSDLALEDDIPGLDKDQTLETLQEEMSGAGALAEEADFAETEAPESAPNEMAHEEGGILDANDLQEVKELLEDEEIAMPANEELSVDDIKIESSDELAALTEEALSEALGEELPAKAEEDFDFADESGEAISEEMAGADGDFEGAHEDATENEEAIEEMNEESKEEADLPFEPAPDAPASIPANDALKSLEGLSIPALKELLEGAELTVSISFPKNKK